jgi:hypothetical protein
MMKSFALAVIVCMLQFSTVTSEFVPFVMLNNGVEETTKFCNFFEWSFVTDELYKAFRGRRALRPGQQIEERSEHKMAESYEMAESRDLQLSRCDGKYTSWRPGCGGKASRRLQGSVNVCSADIKKFNATLDNAMHNLTGPCKAHVGSQRTYFCREILECHVTAIALWNAVTGKLETPVLPPTGTKICSNFTASFEAVTNFQIGDVKFTLRRGNVIQHTSRDSDAPYFAFGSTNYTNLNYKQLDVGIYTLWAVPVKPALHVANMASTFRTIQFEIVAC